MCPFSLCIVALGFQRPLSLVLALNIYSVNRAILMFVSFALWSVGETKRIFRITHNSTIKAVLFFIHSFILFGMTIFVFCLSFISFHLMAICICVCVLIVVAFYRGSFFLWFSLKPINKWMLCLACALFGCALLLSCLVDENEEPRMQPPWILDWLQKVRPKSITVFFHSGLPYL